MSKKLILFIFLSACSQASSIISLNRNNVIYSNTGDEIYIYPLNNKYNLDQPEGKISISPNSEFALIQRQTSNELFDKGGNVDITTEEMCDVVRLSDGCPLSTYQGEICGALWNDDSSIQTSQGNYSIDANDIETQTPKLLAQEIYDTGLAFNISAYLKCYPENKSNREHYHIIKKYLSDNDRQNEAHQLEK
jgi:hypothetical protein